MRYLKLFSILIILSVLIVSCKQEEKFDEKAYSAEFNGYSTEYLAGLKGILIKNMKEGGPLKAVKVCSDTAQALTNLYSDVMGITVKRVSYQNRNVNDTPDEFEKEAINKFAELHSQNNLTAETEILKKVKMNEKEVVRFAKPIFIEAPCLNCHGDANIISPAVAELIKEKYPNDKATGYKIGDLRGVISISKVLE
ncbi:MAG: DUF3365 domain-containing protein [Ignavibacteriae bacterium]|nr:DUF3365 domain-containing protein [Ignavibacteriota bacterium]